VSARAPSDSVLKAVVAGRKIEAIKLLRREQGISLKAAKELVENLPDLQDVEPGSRPSMPRPGREDRGTARFALILLVLAGVAAALYYVI